MEPMDMDSMISLDLRYLSSRVKTDYISSAAEPVSPKDQKFDKIKKLVEAIELHLQFCAENDFTVINKYLQLLSVANDLSIFDPHTSLVTKFYVMLYELMNKVEPSSTTAWCCVDLLRNVCRSYVARKAFIETYQFVPALSKMLEQEMTLEKQIRLLEVLQDLTCGIKISWQIPHLPHLMTTLAKWVESAEQCIVTLSVGILVNLCYKNLPAIYTLSRHVDMKKFFRLCLPMKDSVIQGHVCKLMIIMDHMQGDISDATLPKLVDTTFKAISESFRNRNSLLLRQTVEFFLDVWKQSSEAKKIIDYTDYKAVIGTLINDIKSAKASAKEVPECMAVILEFLNSLLEKNLSSLNGHYLSITELALNWIQNEVVCYEALTVLRTISSNVKPLNGEVLQRLVICLPVLVNLIDDKYGDLTNSQFNRKLSVLFELLRALVDVPSVRDKVLTAIASDRLLKLFIPLLGEGVSPQLRASNNVISKEAVNMYMFTFAFLNDLAKFDENWTEILKDLMRNSNVHVVLAQALYQSPEEVKGIVLRLAASPSFPSHSVANAMEKLQSLTCLNVSSSLSSNVKSSVVGGNFTFPMMSVTQLQRLDDTIRLIQKGMSENNQNNLQLSSIMELYEMKMSTMNHAERAALVNLEASSERCTQLQHHTARLTAELHQLHQLLIHSQQSHEHTTASLERLRKTCKEISNKQDAEKGRNVALASQLEQIQNELVKLKANYNDLEVKHQQITQQKHNLEEDNNKKQAMIGRLSENNSKLEFKLQESSEINKLQEQQIEVLRIQMNDCNTELKQKQSEIQSLNKEMDGVIKELKEKKNIIETITRVAASTRLSS